MERRDIMVKEMVVMIRENQHKLISEEETTITSSEQKNSSWKLYENPFYYSHSPQQQQRLHHCHNNNRAPYLLPSARKLAACLWDLTFIRSVMDSELDMARVKIHELRAELELERKARKKVESLNKKLCKQILEERKKREAVEDICEKLANEIASEKVEMERVKKDIVEERKMLKMAEVFREERVQMKLSEAKIFLEEKLSELEFSSKAASKLEQSKVRSLSMNDSTTSTATMSCSAENSSTASNYNLGGGLINKRRASPEPENPHIKRGIKGFVEFPRVVRAISSRGRQLGSKVECQKAQLRLLLRQKSPFRTTTDNLIMG